MPAWIIDPSPDTVKSGQKTLKLKDAYSQWLFNGGAGFRAAQLLNKQDPQDFDYFVRSKKLTKAKRPKPVIQGAGAASNHKSQMISLLPVARNSVPAGPIHDITHTPAEPGLDAANMVVMGVIDDGVNVFNQRFRPAGHASKIAFAWAQDGPAPQNNATVPFGCEMTGNQITNAMDSGLSERRLLSQHGFSRALNAPYMPDVFAGASNHGTQIADLAAGVYSADVGETSQQMVCVQLPALAVKDTSGASLVSAMHHAAIYVFDRARAISAHYSTPLPVVLNISFGLTGGARNGQQFLERALRALAIKYRKDMRKSFGTNMVPPVVRVVSAGNENILRLHGRAADPGSISLPLRLQPEDSTASYMEIWLPESASLVEIDVTAPNGITGHFSFTGLDAQNPAEYDAYILCDDPNEPVCRITLDAPAKASGQGDALFWRVVLAFAPTQTQNYGRPAAPFGIWKIEASVSNATAMMQAWILRDEPVSGFASNAKQAYFDDDHRGTDGYADTAFDKWGDIAVDDPALPSSVISRNGAISGMATNAMLRRKNGTIKPGDGPEMDTISVGAMRWDMQQACMYSAADSIGNGQAPHVMALAETSRVLPNIRASGTFTDTSSALNGTSAAAPVVARILAQHLSGMNPQDYAGFNPVNYLYSIGIASPRPAGPETASGSGIRVERLRDGGVLLPLPDALKPNVMRDNHAKI